MRLLRKTLLVVLFISILVDAQELPPIVAYSVKDYLGQTQNWKIDQSFEDHIYIGNNSGLLEYNGANWKTYHLLIIQS